ncbi:MAG: peroxiredoxin [Gammaproteobacteria bacterium]|nr:peroxiredoxin [Gammaproteobacteria bacterium]MBU1625426.1 peroxiredoxin [Gammaproteobacteria bacterium]MBU1981686.1 peroxiredoxin [Gammaproteobacteria bacterium]
MKWLILLGLFAALSLLVMQMARAAELPKVGDAAPDFELPDQHGVMHGLQQYAGQWLVLYFYPKDDTPGCTQEACAFRDDLRKLTAMGAVVVGISVDDSESHAEFAEKYHLPFPLLADKSGEVAARYGALLDMVVFKVAKRYTFLIDPQGRVAKVYLKVETSRHSTEVIEDLKAMIAKGK